MNADSFEKALAIYRTEINKTMLITENKFNFGIDIDDIRIKIDQINQRGISMWDEYDLKQMYRFFKEDKNRQLPIYLEWKNFLMEQKLK